MDDEPLYVTEADVIEMLRDCERALWQHARGDEPFPADLTEGEAARRLALLDLALDARCMARCIEEWGAVPSAPRRRSRAMADDPLSAA